jgi:hypothetical protein
VLTDPHLRNGTESAWSRPGNEPPSRLMLIPLKG